MGEEAFAAMRKNRAATGDVLAVAKIAGIAAAKRCSELIPLCHALALDHVDLRFDPDESGPSLGIECEVLCEAKTGAEMEALTGACVAALTVYDMLKALDREMRIGEIALWEKSGGKSGDWRRGA
jgi:cyclic pyranopterin phosphate synthase